jgi:pimeloyl-ACP methyl ester carboxylesterase
MYSDKMNRLVVSYLCKIFIVFALLLLVSVLLIKRFVYFKPSTDFLPIIDTYQEITHQHLHGWLLENKNSDTIILLCHGNTGNISHGQEKMFQLRDLGHSVLAFDYSGYGKSEGIPSEQQLYNDACMMVELIRQKYRVEQIILYGESLGAAVATYVAIRYSIPTLILEGSLPSVKKYINSHYPLFSFLSFLFPEFDTEQYLKGYKGKSLLMHSVSDQKIPYISIEQLIQFSSHHIKMTGPHIHSIIPWEQVKMFIESYR